MDSIFIAAGENSGEKYGASLVGQFKKLHPSFSFFGIGGKHMAAEGVELLHSVEDLGVVGGFEVISHLPRLKKIFDRVSREVRHRKPAAAVLIDSPDFNLRLAKKMKKMSLPVLYYVSPTVWAWRKNRLKTIKKTVKKMMLIFPFEEKIYEQAGIPAVYVGHPLLGKIGASLSRQEFLEKHGLNPDKKLITVLPGSRKSELKYHMEVLPEALNRLQKERDAQFVLLLAESLDRDLLSVYIPLLPEKLRVLVEDHCEAISSSDLVLSSCGTANLETALLETPLIAFYRISPISYSLGRWLVKIDDFSIVNILAGKRIIPELIQKDFTAENILNEANRIFDSDEARAKMIGHFKRIKKILGKKVASQNAALELQKLISG
ncbi:MAG: lipid-A-disaccharide synthase [Candidatus Aminicenantes bacterium]|nr:lipid-A-disaccharide synthase [Candidatus Aminicenantes bacterium]